MFTAAEVNGWFQTLNGLSTTAVVPSAFLDLYLSELNGDPTATPPVPPSASEDQILHELKNYPFNSSGTGNVETSTFYRTTVAQFVLREFQAAWGVVPTVTGAGSQYDNWVARILADPSVQSAGTMSQALSGTTQFQLEYGITGTQLATLGFINKLWANLGFSGSPGPGLLENVGVTPAWEVLQNVVTSQFVINNMYSAVANFQDLLVAGTNVPGSIFVQPGTPGGTLTLTTGIDTPTAGFSTGTGATATTAGAVFTAAPGTNSLGFSNTLNAGDVLLATGAAAGDSTLNYTAVTPAFGGHPADAAGVTMTGVSTANITYNPTNGAAAGFSGDITGLTTVTLTSLGTPGAFVDLGTGAAGLNTALTTVNINTSQILTADFTPAALAAAPTATINVTGGLPGAGVALNPNGGGTGYSALTINSAGPEGTTTNTLNVWTTGDNTATITISGAEFLFIGDGSATTALNIDNLHTFTGASTTTPGGVDTGGIEATFTNPDGAGAVAVTGGSGDNTFIFDSVTAGGALFGTPGFTTASTVNGGTGTDNTLEIEATNGAILLAGVGANITGIQTVEHIGDTTANVTADLSQLGSATTFVLAGDYTDVDATVTNITPAMTVEFSGSAFGTGDVLLEAATPGPGTQINFEMNSAGTAELFLGALTVGTDLPTPQTLDAINIMSMGTASDNVIDNASGIGANINITGGTHLTLGDMGDPYGDAYMFTGTATAGAIINAGTDTGGVTVWLGEVDDPNFPNPSQTFIAGTGTNVATLMNFEATVVDFSKGGTDTVNFTQARYAGDGLLSNNPAVDGSAELYNSVVGWTTAKDTIGIVNSLGVISSSGPVHFTDGGVVPAGPSAILDYTTGSVINASGVADNWIKIDTPTTTTGATADTGFQSAIGAGGSITTAEAFEPYLASFYDSTHGQAVFVTTTSSATDMITNTSVTNVVGLIHMSAADYAALGTGNLHFA